MIRDLIATDNTLNRSLLRFLCNLTLINFGVELDVALLF